MFPSSMFNPSWVVTVVKRPFAGVESPIATLFIVPPEMVSSSLIKESSI